MNLDDFIELSLLLLFLVGGFALGVLLTHLSDQDLIEKFEEPICVEVKVGTETVKRCYILKRVDDADL